MLDKLNDRERIMVIGLAVALFVALLFGGGFQFYRKRGKIRTEVANKRSQLSEIVRIRNTVKSLPVPRNPPSKSELMASAQRLAREFQLENPDIRGSEEQGKREATVKVKIHLRNIPLGRILKFVHAVEYQGRINAAVGNMALTRTISSKEVYNVKLTLYSKRPITKKRKKRRRRRRN